MLLVEECPLSKQNEILFAEGVQTPYTGMQRGRAALQLARVEAAVLPLGGAAKPRRRYSATFMNSYKPYPVEGAGGSGSTAQR